MMNYLYLIAAVFPAPNEIDFQQVFDANLNDNPVALIAVSTSFGLFLILLIYARRQDRQDLEKVRYLPSSITIIILLKIDCSGLG